ncbi:cellulase family glycosylhydrolase [Blastococcus sp. TF02A_35]|uniref:cellulase family glycosylhydrolase n=1 Tax=Blastococcus sp. TF02A-35 TaxID=2559612 RepID=UPI001073311D|nr:cellulase family glycosylhydrolase [Blastococcus sp. TF02A_35]TFV44381.1 hypothetical protein E4P43_18825 [Blastococcus sp. TF02A_35]
MRYPANHVLGAQRNGVNHVSMNMGTVPPGGPVRGTNYPVYPDKLLDWYDSAGAGPMGMTSVRVMFTWEAVQAAANGPVPAPGANYANYWTDLVGVVTRCLARGMVVVLAPWQYNPASKNTDITYQGQPIQPAMFADFWAKLATAVNAATGNDQRVAFDLINEPHTDEESSLPGDIGISLDGWFTCAQAAITAIRSAGNANTVLVPGMTWTSAKAFTTNGSAAKWAALTDPLRNLGVTVHCYSGIDSPGSASPTVLPDACSALVQWARAAGAKVHVGEIAIDAGDNGFPPFGGTLALAQAQWANWQQFCLANDDVVIGWNWWGNSAAGWWNAGDSKHPQGHHWGLSLDDGATRTVYADLIAGSVRTPRLVLHDNLADPGTGENTTTSVAWESPDIWVRQWADGGVVAEPVQGGRSCTVYVRVTNRGTATWPATGTDVVTLHWAKASAGLSWPQPWGGADPALGGRIAADVPIPAPVAPGASTVLAIPWASPPNPLHYPDQDGHFCLLAAVTKAGQPWYDGFTGTNLNTNILRMSHVASRNIHVVPPGQNRFGSLVVENPHREPWRVALAFEPLDPWQQPLPSVQGRLVLRPPEHVLHRLRGMDNLTEAGPGRVALVEPGRGLQGLVLEPGERLAVPLEWEGEAAPALRAVAYDTETGPGTPTGGQTFVLGEVEGWTVEERAALV